MNGSNFDGKSLLSVVRRLEGLEDEKRVIGTDIREVRKEAKANGFDVEVINFLIRERRKDQEDVKEFQQKAAEYRGALNEAVDL